MKKSALLLVAAVALSFGAAWFAVTLYGHRGPAPVAAVQPTPSSAASAADPGMVYPLPERVLNLTSTSGVPHYARIEVAISFARPPGRLAPKLTAADAKATIVPLDPDLAPVVAHKVQIDDALVRVVGSRTLDDLTTTAGREALKRDFLDAVKQVVTAPMPEGVYILDLVVQ